MPRLITQLGEFPDELRGGGLAIGNFDAIHRGHAALVSQLVHASRQIHGPSIVFTFDPPPARILQPEFPSPPALTWIDRRVEVLGQLGVDVVIAYPTDRRLLDMNAADFFRQVVVDRIGARVMVEGPNFMFGKDRAGNIAVLRDLCRINAITLHIVEPQSTQTGELISSSRVRCMIGAGQMTEVNRLLVRPYRLRGTVARGAGRGNQLGFPTANLHSIPVLIPAEGVYAGSVVIDGNTWPAAINVGTNPTFADNQNKVEVHIIGWRGMLYDRQLEVDILARVRNVRRFESQQALVQQIQDDIQVCTSIAVR